MQLKELIQRTQFDQKVVRTGPDEVEIKGLAIDSRTIQSGQLFVAIRGFQRDSHELLPEVCTAGAVALVVESTVNIPAAFSGLIIEVENSRQALAELSAAFFNYPSREFCLIGVTGTNGKTTSTYLMEHLLATNGHRVGVVGTVNQRFMGQSIPSKLTTPNAFELQSLFADWRDQGATAVVMEVSSIAVDQHRVTGCDFDVAIFTNLTRDHLGYHQTMDNYFAAKKGFFDLLQCSTKPKTMAVINTRDPWGQKLENEFSGAKVSSQIDLSPTLTPRFIEFDWSGVRKRLPMVGAYNVENLASSLKAVEAVIDDVMTVDFSEFAGVPGRMEIINLGQGRVAYVDYAHTPDALSNSLKALKDVSDEDIVVVFGCGGDRDRGKRALMAEAAESFADRVYVTSDNPRNEDPQQIIDDVCSGFSDEFRTRHVTALIDRRKAVGQAVSELPQNALLLIAGKGHENYQEINGVRHPMDDKDLIGEALS